MPATSPAVSAMHAPSSRALERSVISCSNSAERVIYFHSRAPSQASLELHHDTGDFIANTRLAAMMGGMPSPIPHAMMCPRCRMASGCCFDSLLPCIRTTQPSHQAGLGGARSSCSGLSVEHFERFCINGEWKEDTHSIYSLTTAIAGNLITQMGTYAKRAFACSSRRLYGWRQRPYVMPRGRGMQSNCHTLIC